MNAKRWVSHRRLSFPSLGKPGPLDDSRQLRGGIARRSVAPWPLLALILAWMVAGCAGRAALREGPAGLPAREAARLSLIVAQTRAQFPDLSGSAIPFQTRGTGEEGTSRPELALSGEGTGVRPGVQYGTPSHVRVELYLDKHTYTTGYLQVRRDGRQETWPIVAFDLLGQHTGSFDYTYVLTDQQGKVHYLVLIGGNYDQDQTQYVGYEGTLIVPGPGNNLEEWESAYKIDFGYAFPARPVYQVKVEEAEKLYRDLSRSVVALETLRDRIAQGEGKLAERKAPPAGDQQAGAPATDEAAGLEADIAAWRQELQAKVPEVETTFLTYYTLRREISDEYAAFVNTNPYRWQDLQTQQRFFDAWKPVEYHHPRIDNLVSAFLPFLKDGSRLLAARTTAMDTIRRNNNWAKFPGDKP